MGATTFEVSITPRMRNRREVGSQWFSPRCCNGRNRYDRNRPTFRRRRTPRDHCGVSLPDRVCRARSRRYHRSKISLYFAIPSWNPQAGLSFVLILLCGLRLFPFLFIAPLLADIVNQPVLLPWKIEILSAFLIGTSYSILFVLLSAPKIHFRPSLMSMRDLVC